MQATPESGLGIPRARLVWLFVIIGGFFALTGLLADWYKDERLSRAEHYFELGQKLAGGGRNAEAIEEFRNALAIARDSGEYRLALARALIGMGRQDEAAIYLHELLASEPTAAVPNLLLARIAAEANRPEQAISYYQRAVFGQWPERAAENRNKARWELVALLAKDKADNQVIAELLEILDASPGDLENKKRVASMLLERKSAAQAAKVFRELIREAPQGAETYSGLGHAELALGNYTLAQSALRRAARLNPDDKDVRASLELVGRILELDPTLRRLGSDERYRRSQVLLESTVAALERCLASHQSQPEAALKLLENAKKALKSRRTKRYAEATDDNLDLAEQLWTTRAGLCKPETGDEALARVLSRLFP